MRIRVGALARALTYVALGLVVAAASIALALLVTPMSKVSFTGQTVSVGATGPSLSLSGPGEFDLFGQELPTTLQFVGPIRPRLALSHIVLNRQITSAFASGKSGVSEKAVGSALASGWRHYFVWETLVTGAFALVLIGAISGWLRIPWRRSLLLLGAGLIFVEAVNLGAVMVTAYSAPGRLGRVGSLEALVGRAPLPSVPPVTGPPQSDVQAVVMGDSTAAGLGNSPLPNPSPLDRACQRSADTYARDLAAVNGWRVLNLACSGATVDAGMLGPQGLSGVTAPPQVGAAKKVTRASVVIISIGADDVHWSALLRLCAVAKTCNNNASTAYFQQQLASFTTSYYQLLRQLSSLPSHPRVLINLYYNPFDTDRHCLDGVGLTPDKEKSLVGLLDALNSVLARGARASSSTPVQPDFTGHAICDPHPYVQGLHDPAPFHPTAAGELAIALADEHVLQQHVLQQHVLQQHILQRRSP